MQFTREDRERYQRLVDRRTACRQSQTSLADLTSYLGTDTLEHCGASGFRVESTLTKCTTQLSGAHRILGTYIWSDSPVRSATSKKRKRKRRGSLRFDNGRTYFGSAGGLTRGLDVHTELARFVMWPPTRFRALYTAVDPMTKAALVLLKKLGYTGVHAEYMVYSTALRVGTAVDLVCLDATGGIVFIELKTGYDDGVFTKSRKTMCAPFQQIRDSALNRARTQLLLAIMLYRRNHDLTPRGIVLHVDSRGCAMSFDMGNLGSTAASAETLYAVIAAGRQTKQR